jgi:hypothetical protein
VEQRHPPRSPGDAAGSDRAAEIAALTLLLERLARPVLVTVRDDRGEPLATFRIDAEAAPPAGPARHAPHPCRQLILDLLTDAHPRRLSMPEILAEMQARGGREWSQRHATRFLDELKADGAVDNAKEEGRGQGYGFPS